ncbi:MAG: lysophospholipid acyltransferase family protein [Fusobacteriaceae bacterium]|jgi:lysophospholipid acyltransferase (LPLAT)-like uncharacterized protein|nr:lysophospholipid acyltransferase family protein [Fusobacteriaceae bacterium]
MNEKRKYRVIGGILFCILKILALTLRMKIIDESSADLNERGYIVSFWHRRLLIPVLATRARFARRAVLVSPSKDGELISVALEKMGFVTIRGSSGENSVYGLMGLMRHIKRGYSIGTPLDGPRGPAESAKPGLLYIAEKTGSPVLPLGGAYKRKLTLKKTWDRFQIPLPFSKAVCIIGRPILPADEADLEALTLRTQEAITALDARAERYLAEN